MLVVATAVGAVGGCGSRATVDYDAVPLSPDPAASDRMTAEREGLRITLGPPSQFPYESAAADSAAADTSGVYRLFTRVRVENRGAEPAVVRWRQASLVGPAGVTMRLVPATDGGAPDAAGERANPSASTDSTTVRPGGSVLRGLLPLAEGDTIPVDRPLVPLCDGCVYRLRLPARVGAMEHVFVFPFRLVARRPDSSIRLLFWEMDGP